MTHTNAPLISIDLIDDSDRQRQDLGDLTSLAESIQSIGLIHPIVLTDELTPSGHRTLIAGGRRLATFRALGLTEIPYNLRSTVDEADLREAELEENLQRKEMTWQETVRGIARIHDLRSRRANYNTSVWGLRQTGQLLGIAHSHIANCITVSKALDTNPDVAKSENLTDAIRTLLGQREAEATKLLSKAPTTQPTPTLLIDLAAPKESGSVTEQDTPAFLWTETRIKLTETVLNVDCLNWMRLHPASVDHIITDPPYGIDMKNLGTFVDIDRVEAEHDVEENLALLPAFFMQAFETLKETGYCVTWCDMQHFEKMMTWSIAAGFKVQRWPLIWRKLHPCINNCAQYNTTKDYEVALVSRKGNATLLKPQGSSVFEANGATERKMYRNPFAKPFVLWKWLFDMVALPGQTILDPFAGEGSGPCAAINCGLSPIALEVSEEHYPALVENVKKAYQLVLGGKAVFE